jgi:hypothetical protein
MKNYRGVVKDSMGFLDPRKTKRYNSYKAAHDAAELLCKRTIGSRGIVTVLVTD